MLKRVSERNMQNGIPPVELHLNMIQTMLSDIQFIRMLRNGQGKNYYQYFVNFVHFFCRSDHSSLPEDSTEKEAPFEPDNKPNKFWFSSKSRSDILLIILNVSVEGTGALPAQRIVTMGIGILKRKLEELNMALSNELQAHAQQQ